MGALTQTQKRLNYKVSWDTETPRMYLLTLSFHSAGRPLGFCRAWKEEEEEVEGCESVGNCLKKGGRYRRRGAEREKIQTSLKRGRREGGAVGEGIK